MATSIAKLDVNKIAPNITLTVKIVGQTKFIIKLWIARQLIKLASHVTGMNVKFEQRPWYGSDL